mmetsp:Transcript_26395/g.51435  ORF Transcript_26395/g.51435 Transcript_26395/m.51435 type:complete len:220 (+) Transcript_26395:31-690(+)
MALPRLFLIALLAAAVNGSQKCADLTITPSAGICAGIAIPAKSCIEEGTEATVQTDAAGQYGTRGADIAQCVSGVSLQFQCANQGGEDNTNFMETQACSTGAQGFCSRASMVAFGWNPCDVDADCPATAAPPMKVCCSTWRTGSSLLCTNVDPQKQADMQEGAAAICKKDENMCVGSSGGLVKIEALADTSSSAARAGWGAVEVVGAVLVAVVAAAVRY